MGHGTIFVCVFVCCFLSLNVLIGLVKFGAVRFALITSWHDIRYIKCQQLQYLG